MELRRTESTQGMFCKNCDWAVVSTFIPEIRRDIVEYELRVLGGDKHNYSHVRAVSSVMGVNFLEAREILENSRDAVFSGRAVDVLRVKKILDSSGVKYGINPYFIYS